jgi:hypothetical protein
LDSLEVSVKTRVAGVVVSMAALALGVAVLSLPSVAQNGDGKAKAKGKKGPTGPVTHKPIPRTADGKPDLTGTWQAGGVSITGEAGAPPLHPLPPIDQHTVTRQPLAYKPELDAKRKALTTLDDPTLYCFLPGVPRIQTMPMPLEILQTPKEIAILYESFRAWRRIPIGDTLKHPDDLTPTWMGDSVGKWEGDTLVVSSIGFNDKSWLDVAGHPHSEDMRVEERFHRRDFGHTDLGITVDDPKMYTRPISFKITEVLVPDSDVLESVCNENEKDRAHIAKP